MVTRTAAFTVAGCTPVLTAITPTSGQQGQTLDVAVTGQCTHFVQGTTGASFGAGILVNGVTVHSPTTRDGQRVDRRRRGAQHPRRHADDRHGSGHQDRPRSPSTAGTPGDHGGHADERPAGPDARRRGDRVSTPTSSRGRRGANFGAGILVNGVTVHSPTSATVNVSIAADATLTTRDVTLTTGTEVVTKTAAFTVVAGTPVLTADQPDERPAGPDARRRGDGSVHALRPGDDARRASAPGSS